MGLQTNSLRQDLRQRRSELSAHISDLAQASNVHDSPWPESMLTLMISAMRKELSKIEQHLGELRD